MSENKSLPVLGTKKVFEDLRDEVFCKIEFVEFIPNLDEYVMNKTKWDVSDKQDGSVMAWLDGDTLKISGNGTILANENCEELFCEFKKVETIKFNGLLNTDNMKNAKIMFCRCEKLKSIDLGDWNTENLVSSKGMFGKCENLENIDLSDWNIHNLKESGWMFDGCKSLENIDVSEWNTGNLQDANGMFKGCKSLTNIDVADWNTEKLQDANRMFQYCNKFENVDVANWNTQNLKEAWGMFDGCTNLEMVDVSKWDTKNLQDVRKMFRGCECLKKVIIYDLKFMDEIEDKSIIEFYPSLNTMDTFCKGFKIIRNGEIITLTDEEMFDFRYLEQACEGRRSFEWFLDENESNEINNSLIKELMEDEEACYNVREEYYDAIMQDGGLIENECTTIYINRFK